MSGDTPLGESVADLIPRWFEGGTPEQMLDEALAQLRRVEGAARRIAPFVNAAFVATPEQACGERFEALRSFREAL